MFLAVALTLALMLGPGCRSRPVAVGVVPDAAAGAIPGPTPAAGEGPAPKPEPAAALIWVHVCGAVSSPGVYSLPPGSRAWDAVRAAGGLRAGAAADGVNLAAALSDGQQLRIPTKAELETAAAAWTGGSAAGAGGAAGLPPSRAAPLDLNLAGEEALQRLPGIGPVLAARIVAYRQAQGRFATVDDLLSVSGIGPRKLDEFRHLVTVR